MTQSEAPDAAADYGRLHEIADQVLGLVPAGAEAQVLVQTGQEALTRFAGSFIHQNVAETVTNVMLKVTVEGASAVASINQIDADALRGLAGRATDAARVRPADPDWPGLTGPAPLVHEGNYDPATAVASPDERAARVRAFVDACEGLESAGYCNSASSTAVYANSAGQRVAGRTTSATVDGVARTPTSDGSGRASSVRLGDLDGAALGRLAAAKARGAADATDLPPGRYEVVLEPSCVADILLFLDVYGFNGRAVHEQTSFAKLGEAQFDPSIDIWDDAADLRIPGLPFDAEGTPKRRVDLVTGGVTTSVVHDRRTARMSGTETTGHAIPGGESFGAVATNLVIGGGDQRADDLIASVERGLLVTDFWYSRILDPRSQVVTGLTRNGVYLIEDGKVTRPVTNLRYTQSYVEALAPGNVLGIGDDVQPVESQFGFVVAVPTLRLASFNFTGGAKG
ncbi:MAG: TldD/PmbA family protein [Frankiaceae bacterium]